MQTRVRYLCVDHVLAIKWFQMPSEQYANFDFPTAIFWTENQAETPHSKAHTVDNSPSIDMFDSSKCR